MQDPNQDTSEELPEQYGLSVSFAEANGEGNTQYYSHYCRNRFLNYFA